MQKAVTTVVQAVQHVREIEGRRGCEPISVGYRQQATAVLGSQDQCRVGFLQAEVLIMAIEHFAIALAGHDVTRFDPRKHPRGAWMVGHFAFDVDRFNHGVMRAGKGKLSTSSRSAANTAAASRQVE